MPEHSYLSTACGHKIHRRCRLTCKFCGAPCECRCHSDGLEPDRELREQIQAAVAGAQEAGLDPADAVLRLLEDMHPECP